MMVYVMTNEEDQIIGAVDTKRVVAFAYEGTSPDYYHRYMLKLDYGHTLTVSALDMQNILSAMEIEGKQNG